MKGTMTYFSGFLLVAILATFATPTYADIYKCTATSGAVTYQQKPCEKASDKEEAFVPLPPPSQTDQIRAENRLHQIEQQQSDQTETRMQSDGGDAQTTSGDDGDIELEECENEVEDNYLHYWPKKYEVGMELCKAGLTADQTQSCLAGIASWKSRQVFEMQARECVMKYQH